MSVLILSTLSMASNHAFAASSPSLGTANTFGVLAATTVTNTGGTVITGNLGLSPGTSVTGFPPGAVNGATYTSDSSSAAQARTDANAAYGALSSAVCTTTYGPITDIGGQTLTPGVYCFPTSAAITGTLTLSGSGVYIFKMGSTLVTAAGPGASNVALTNGASASNVFWAVASSATLGTYSNFKGTIIALTSITSTTGATVDGRLLALNGAVTLDTNRITVGTGMADTGHNDKGKHGTGPKLMSDAISGNFAILASTYTNTSPGTSIAGDLGYTTGPAVAPTVNGIIHVADGAYSQAGTAQNSATSAAQQACTTNLGTTVDLSTVQGGVYTPGVYCTTGAASIGAGGITLSGNGNYIFKIDGALTTVSGSAVNLNGAQASSVSWVPTGATTLGASSSFAGTILDASGVTISSGVSMTGRVLAFGGTVSTASDTITVPSYAMSDAISGCTFTFPTGAIDLGSNVYYGAKVYPSGVYCINGAANIGSGPITLSGNGAHIFKINGALGQAANTDVILSNGALASGVIWMPTGATTIGANSHLIGTVNGAPITIGANSDINGMGPAKLMSDAISGCTFTFPTGAIDLGSNVYYGAKVYPSGVYCINGAANIGSGPITLSGNGAHIFKINGALGQAANTDVILSNGALASGVIWMPTGATTIGANSHLIGTVTGAPITIGANSDINGMGPAKVMADTLTVPSYAISDKITAAPEFGTVATLILIVAIVSVIAVSARTRLHIMPKY